MKKTVLILGTILLCSAGLALIVGLVWRLTESNILSGASFTQSQHVRFELLTSIWDTCLIIIAVTVGMVAGLKIGGKR